MLDESYVQPLDSTAEQIDIVRIRTDRNRRRMPRMKELLQFIGPAFIVSVAYIDPGNFATNISGGSQFNYDLIWVILWSNLMAIFLQSLSAKLGIATGCNLPQACGKVFSRRTNWCLWVVAELAAMATDLAEFLGGALGFYLLFHIPMVYAGIITAVITFLILFFSKYGQRLVEAIIAVLVGVICLSYTLQLVLAKPDWALAGFHALIPSIPNSEAVLVAVGMLGATVMPHVIYLHSQLVQHRNKGLSQEDKLRHYKLEKFDITIAMNVAFVVNAAMVIAAAAVFYHNGVVVTSIEQAQKSLYPLLGAASSGAFAIALIASGLSSSAVGTMAGQTIMQGFVGLKISDNATRLVTMLPGMLILLSGVNPMKILILSQVTLSFILPFAIIPLLIITKKKDLMGCFVNKPYVNVIGWIITSIILCANVVLLVLTFSSILKI